MTLNDLLRQHGLDPSAVLVLRHRPHEPTLRKVLPWLAAERPEVFNAYQQTQGERLEAVMQGLNGNGYVASFIGHEPGKALFIGLYKITASKQMTHRQYWRVAAYKLMKTWGMKGWIAKESNRRLIRWFDLKQHDFYKQWKGRLVIDWPPPERSWWRRAHRNEMPVVAILTDSLLTARMPPWETLDLGWEELQALPTEWKSALSQWRGVYYIFDSSAGKGYVGSAYGDDNILGRWRNYGKNGDGGNNLLKGRNPHFFRFSILQRVSPDMEPGEVIRLEASWKSRLHTHTPFGLNGN
jgi:hypothetical protein